VPVSELPLSTHSGRRGYRKRDIQWGGTGPEFIVESVLIVRACSDRDQPTRYDLAIKFETAKALGVVIPHALLERADHVLSEDLMKTVLV